MADLVEPRAKDESKKPSSTITRKEREALKAAGA